MTKTVRIENGCTNNTVKLKVVRENQNVETGEWIAENYEYPLDYPTAMHNITLWKGARLVVYETD